MHRVIMKPDERPIGYWLKHLDTLIETMFDTTLSREGLTRRHWQVLHAVGTDLMGALHVFWTAGASTPEQVIADLAACGWVRVEAGQPVLTPEGKAAHAQLAQTVAAIRARAADGVSHEDYAVTIATLRRMSDNLERLPA